MWESSYQIIFRHITSMDKLLSHSPDLNRRPATYEIAALPTELEWQINLFSFQEQTQE